MKNRILLIEDDVQLKEMLTAELAGHPYDVDSCLDGRSGFSMASRGHYGLIILDRMLPDMDGTSVLKKLRGAGIYTPVLLLTALDSLQDKIDGFQAGADDYLTKPFHIEELLARAEALLRRPASLQGEASLSCYDLILDRNGHTLRCGSRETQLTKTEFGLLECFLKNPSRVFSREELLSCVWGAHTEVESANVDNYIYFLRRHLKALKSRSSLQTIYGIGYAITENSREDAEKNGPETLS